MLEYVDASTSPLTKEKRLFVDVIQDFPNSYLKHNEVLTTSSWKWLESKLRSILCMKYEKLYIKQSFATSVNTTF